MTAALAALVFAGCAKTLEPYTTASVDDVPRILQPDFPQGEGGVAPDYKTITTAENLNISVIVTPADYCTVEWYDYEWTDEAIATGLTIDVPLMAGKHEITVKVSTKAGKTTSRTFGVSVASSPSDPVVNKGLSRWYIPGTEAKVEGKNLEGITKICLGDAEISVAESSDESFTFNVPSSLAEGLYRIIVEKGGVLYACGVATVTSEPYVEENVTEILLWNKETAKLAWTAFPILGGDPATPGLNETVAKYIEDGVIGVGSVLMVSVSPRGEDAAGALTTTWWNDINTGVQWEEAGLKTAITEDMTFEYTISTMEFINAQGIAVVGNNFVVTEVKAVVPAFEHEVYVGPSAKLSWNALEFKDDKLKALGLNENAVIKAYVSGQGSDAAGAITTSWWNDINTGAQWEEAGLKTDIVGEMILEYTIEKMDFINEQGFALVGNNYIVDKITVTGGIIDATPGDTPEPEPEPEPGEETVIYTGPSEKLAWSACTIEDKSAIQVGSVLTAYLTADSGAQGGFATCGWKHLNDVSKAWDGEGTSPWAVNSLESGEQTITWTVTSMDAMNADGLAVVGNGFVVNKVTVK